LVTFGATGALGKKTNLHFKLRLSESLVLVLIFGQGISTAGLNYLWTKYNNTTGFKIRDGSWPLYRLDLFYFLLKKKYLF